MKKILFAIAALMISTLSFAQGFGGGFGGGQGMNMNPEDMAKRQADRLKEQLELNQVQYDSIYNYYVANAKEQAARREQMQNGGGQPAQEDMQAMREQMQKQRAAQEAKIKSFLTDDQKKKYDEIQEQRRQQRQQGGQGGFGGGFGGGMPQGGFGGGRPQ